MEYIRGVGSLILGILSPLQFDDSIALLANQKGLLPSKLGHHHLIVAYVDKDGLLDQPTQLLPLSLELELRFGHESRAACGARVVRIKIGFRV